MGIVEGQSGMHREKKKRLISLLDHWQGHLQYPKRNLNFNEQKKLIMGREKEHWVLDVAKRGREHVKLKRTGREREHAQSRWSRQ
jgi:hypothetical protein